MIPLINVFEHAVTHRCNLLQALRDLDANAELRMDAVKYRIHVAVDEHVTNYNDSLVACVRRLRSAN